MSSQDHQNNVEQGNRVAAGLGGAVLSAAGSGGQFGPQGLARWRLIMLIARREMRQVVRQFRLFLALLACGVFAIAVVGSFSASLSRGLERDGRVLLGGDVAFSTPMRSASEEELAFLRQRYEVVSASATLTSMARTEGERFRLVNVRAVDDNFPLVQRDVVLDGRYDPALLGRGADGRWGVAIAEELLGALRIGIGDTIKIGNASFAVRALLSQEPEIPLGRPQLAPRVLMSLGGVEASGILRPGSIFSQEYRVLAAEGTDLAAERRAVRDLKPDSEWRIATARGNFGRIGFIIDTGSDFFTLVGLVSLMVASIGMVSGVNTYVDSRRKSIAIMKALGADSGLIIGVYLTVIMMVASIGVTIGLALAVLVSNAAAYALGGDGILRLAAGVFVPPLLTGAVYGLGASLAGALWPLSRVPGFYPQALFRDLVSSVGWKGRYRLLSIAGAVCLVLAAFTFYTFGVTRLTLILVSGMFISPIVLLVCAALLRRGLSLLPQARHPVLRLAIHNFCRPGAFVYAIFLSVGLGLTLLTTMALVDARVSGQFSSELRTEVPSFFIVGLQRSEIEQFRELAREYVQSEDNLITAPNSRGRILTVNGLTAEELEEQGIESWALRGDRGITWSQELPENSALAAGEWWSPDYAGVPLVSLTSDVAEDLQMQIGDTITYSISGRPITATLASTRDVKWNSFGVNFATVFDPATMRNAPGGYIATVKIPEQLNDSFVLRQQELFPAATPIRVQAAMEVMRNIIGNLLIAVRAAGGFALVVGVMVLAGALTADHQRRAYEVTVYTVCGVADARIIGTYATEYAVLAAVLVSAVVGLSWAAVVTTLDLVFSLNFDLNLNVHVGTPVIGFLAVVVAGLIATAIALREKPTTRLRSGEAFS